MEHLEAQPLICKPYKRFITRFSELPILEKPCLQSGKIPIEPLSRKVCLLPVDTDNGNVLIRETKTSDDLTVPKGIYSVTNWVSAVEVANESNEPQIVHVEQPLRSEPLSNYNECNFHIANDEPHMDLPAIHELIQTDHLNSEEYKALIKLCEEFEEIFFKEGQQLTFSNQMKHRITTKDDLPIYTKTI